MKKTFNINVAGFPFTIDEDAYSLLHDYLSTIENAFSKEEDAEEIVNDIEMRVAELLTEASSQGSPIVTVADVEEVISRVGQPEEMIETDTVSEENITIETTTTRVVPPPYTGPRIPIRKKLYRDPQNAMLGGVCSGLAWYLNLDPTVVRLATVLLTILSASTVGLAYIILWIVVPEAVTPLERMQMMGEQPTMQNIAKTVTDSFRDENTLNDSVIPTRHSFGDTLATFFGVCARVFVIIGLVFAIPLLVALAIGLLGCIFALIVFATGMGAALIGEGMPVWYSEAGSIPVWGVLCGIGSILTIGIPLFVLIRMGLRKKAIPTSQGVRNMLLIVWVVGFILAAISAGRIVNLANEMDLKDAPNEKVETVTVNEDGVEIITSDDSTADNSLSTDSISKEESEKGANVSITSEGIIINNDSVKIKIGK